MTLNYNYMFKYCDKKQKTQSLVQIYDCVIYLVMFSYKISSIVAYYYITPNLFLEVIYNSYASMKTFTQKGTHTCTHTNIHAHDPVPTDTLTFHPYDPLLKPSGLAVISIFSQYQTN